MSLFLKLVVAIIMMVIILKGNKIKKVNQNG